MPESNENVIIKKKSDKPTLQNEGHIEPIYRKIMRVTSKTAEVSVDELLVELMQYANIADALNHVEKTLKYVVEIPLKHKEAFQTGKVFINQNSKTGVMWPTLYKTLDTGKRQFVDNLPIKQERIIHGNPFESIAVSYHNIYMQQQIKELSEIMSQTYKAVERIEQGQMDDRIGLLLAGRDQILLSMYSAPEERMVAIDLGRSNMLTAQKQLLQTFKRRVRNFEAIPKNIWGRFWIEFKHSGSFRRKDKEFSEIQEYYALYLQATQMVATSYIICGQLEAAEQVFEIAEQDMKEIDFNALKTLRYIHKENADMLYFHAAEYVATEREICLEDAYEYDAINIEVSGEKLLETFENGRSKEISKAGT